MSNMYRNESPSTNGVLRVTLMPSKNVSIAEALGPKKIARMKEMGLKIPRSRVIEGNLVVNTGRQKLAFFTGKRKSGSGVPIEDSYIDRLVLGNCSVGGVVDKSNNLPDLRDVALVSEIKNLAGVSAGKFALDPNTEIFYPSSAPRYPNSFGGFAPTTATITIDGGTGLSYLEDVSASFITTSGVQMTDQISANAGVTSNLVTFGIEDIISETMIRIHNPNQFTGVGVEYRIDSPGTQVLFSKFLDGNNFDEATFGYVTMIHEAGLLFNDGTLFNRVVFVPSDNQVGILLQSDESTGIALSARFEWLVTY